MLCRIFFLLFCACTKIDISSDDSAIRITTTLITPEHQEEYSVIKNELERAFFTTHPIQKECNVAIEIEKTEQYSGLTSTTFSVNMTVDFVVKYHLQCNDKTKTNGIVKLNGDLTLVQDKTLGQYVGERHIVNEISKRSASIIYNEIKIFLILHNKKLDK
ncbi:MAG: hypothetical protein O3A66_02960 [Proteobacteria bacterium]|nr:hypothetical protein [Pseudomonadota bacterium]